jgi:4-hydroxy-tetrahydrodipicolinate synthase
MTAANNHVRGVYTAIATPFDNNGDIDWPAFEKLLTMQMAGGIDGVVLFGTTGESPTLTVQEKLSLIRKAKAFCKTNLQIMAGAGGNNTQQSIEMAKLAVDAGADTLLIVTPPYNKPSLDGLLQHFGKIGEEAGVPVCLYHVPSRTGQHLTVDEVVQICKLPKVTSVKEASGNMAFFSRCKAATSASMMSGDDITLLPSLSVGGQGVVSVISNLFPKAWKGLYSAFFKQDYETALKIHEATLEINQVLYCESNPIPLKAAMEMAGLCKNILRLPLAPVTNKNRELVAACLKRTQSNLASLGYNEG